MPTKGWDAHLAGMVEWFLKELKREHLPENAEQLRTWLLEFGTFTKSHAAVLEARESIVEYFKGGSFKRSMVDSVMRAPIGPFVERIGKAVQTTDELIKMAEQLDCSGPGTEEICMHCKMLKRLKGFKSELETGKNPADGAA